MKRLLKSLGIFTAGLILVLALVVTFLDLNSFRKPIVTAISEATGLGIEINGLALDPAKGLGVKAEGLKVTAPNQGETLFSADALFLEARFLPLLSGRFEVDDVSVVRPRLDLFVPPVENPPVLEGESPPQLSPEKKESAVPEKIRKLFRNLKVDVGNIHIEEGQFQVSPGPGLPPIPLIASFNLAMDRQGQENYKIELTDLSLQANGMTLTGKVNIPNVLDKKGTVDAELGFQPFALSSLRAWFPLLPDSSQEDLNRLALAGNARQLDIQTSLAIETLGDMDRMIHAARAKIITELFKVTVNLAGRNWRVDSWREQLVWADGRLAVEGGGQTLGGNLQLVGDLSPSLDPSSKEGFLSNLKLTVNDIHFDQWTPEGEWMPIAGTLSGQAKIKGPLDLPHILDVNADFKADQLVLNSPAEFSNMPIGFPQLKGNIKMQGDQMHHKVEGVFLDAPFTVQGIISKDAERAPDARFLNTEIQVSQVALAALQPWFPEGWAGGQGQLVSNIKIIGPLDDRKNLRIATTLQSDEFILRSPESLGAAPLTFSRFKAKATLSKGNLYQDIDTSVLGGHLTWKGKLTLPGNDAVPAISGNGKLGPMGLESLMPFLSSAKNAAWKPVSGQMKAAFSLEGPIKGNRLRARSALTGTNWKVQAPKDQGGLMISLPSWYFNGQWENGVLRHRLKANAFQGKFDIEGELKIPPDQGSMEIDSKVHIEHAAFKSLAPLINHPWAPKEGSISGHVQIEGPLDNLPKWRMKGKFKAGGLVLKPGEQLHSIALASITAQAPPGKPSMIDFSLDRVTTGNIPLKQVKGKIALAENEVQVKEVKIFPEHGDLNIQGTYVPQGKKYQFEFIGTGLRAEDFYKKYMDGAVQLQGTLKGHVPEQGPATRELSGNVKLKASDGNLQNMETLKAILVVLNPTSVLNLGRKGYPYKSLGGNVLIERGKASSSDLKLLSDDMRLYVEGATMIPTEKMDLTGKFIPAEGLNKAVKAIPLLGQVIAGGKKGGLIETPFTVKGTWKKPKVSLGRGKK